MKKIPQLIVEELDSLKAHLKINQLQRADSRNKKNYNPAACGQKPHSQKDRQDEKAEGYVPDEGTI